MPERRDPLPLKWLNNLLLLRYRITVIGRRNLPQGMAVIACNHVLHTDFRFHLKAITHSLRFLGLRDSTPWEAVNSLIRLFFRLTLGFVDKVAESFVVFMDKGRPIPTPREDRHPRERSFQYAELVNREVERLLHLNRFKGFPRSTAAPPRPEWRPEGTTPAEPP